MKEKASADAAVCHATPLSMRQLPRTESYARANEAEEVEELSAGGMQPCCGGGSNIEGENARRERAQRLAAAGSIALALLRWCMVGKNGQRHTWFATVADAANVSMRMLRFCYR